MSFLNSFSTFRILKRHFIKTRNIFLDRISSVSKMTKIAQIECTKAYNNFCCDVNTYGTTLFLLDNIDDSDSPDHKRYFKFSDDIEFLKERIDKLSNSSIDSDNKKIELRKIINKAIRMRKFYSY